MVRGRSANELLRAVAFNQLRYQRLLPAGQLHPDGCWGFDGNLDFPFVAYDSISSSGSTAPVASNVPTTVSLRVWCPNKARALVVASRLR